jgi:RND family efflux transporter MFP subunit
MSKKWIFVVLIGMGLSAGCKPPEEEKAEVVVPAVPVETMKVSTRTFVDMVDVSGVVEPIHEVHVAAEAPGRVLSAPFEEGERVKKGAMLLRVDSQVDSARIALLESQLESAEREFQRTKQLAGQGLATPQQLDQAQSSVDGARLNIKQARVGMGKTNVRSPIDGVVAQKMTEQGEYVNPGSPLAHIVDFDTVKVIANVAESDVRFVTEGTDVQVWIPALEKYVEGKVKKRAILATANTRTFPVEIHVANADHSILPGMRARVVVPRKDYGEVVVVPREAILEGFERPEAMIFDGEGDEGKAVLRVVKLGPAKGSIVVVEEGLKPNERLIVKGHRSLADGTKIRSVKEVKDSNAAEVAPSGKAQVVEDAAEADRGAL